MANGKPARDDRREEFPEQRDELQERLDGPPPAMDAGEAWHAY